MAQLTAFGKDVKKKLVDIDKPQVWLIEQVKKSTGLYFDDSYLWKILAGQIATPKIIRAICEILDLSDQTQAASSE